MSSGTSCSGAEACRPPCPRDERHPDRSADSQSAQSDPARTSTTGLPQVRHRPSPRPGARAAAIHSFMRSADSATNRRDTADLVTPAPFGAQQQPHKAARRHRQGEPKGRSDRPLRPASLNPTPHKPLSSTASAPIPGTPRRVAPGPKAQSRQAKSQTPLCPSHAALEGMSRSLLNLGGRRCSP